MKLKGASLSSNNRVVAVSDGRNTFNVRVLPFGTIARLQANWLPEPTISRVPLLDIFNKPVFDPETKQAVMIEKATDAEKAKASSREFFLTALLLWMVLRTDPDVTFETVLPSGLSGFAHEQYGLDPKCAPGAKDAGAFAAWMNDLFAELDSDGWFTATVFQDSAGKRVSPAEVFTKAYMAAVGADVTIKEAIEDFTPSAP